MKFSLDNIKVEHKIWAIVIVTFVTLVATINYISFG